MASRTELSQEVARQVVDIRKHRRVQLWLSVTAVVALLAVGIAVVLLLVANDRQGQGIQQLNSALATTCGQTDKARLPGGVVEDCDRAQQGQLPLVLRGIAGSNGTNGNDGQNGRDGTNGRDGQNGTNGASGGNGTDGKPGEDGADGQSPPCLSEETMCRGIQGFPGAPGMPPVGWTTEFPDGGRQTCARVADFNPDAPFYNCDYQGPAPAAEQPEPATDDPGLGTN